MDHADPHRLHRRRPCVVHLTLILARGMIILVLTSPTMFIAEMHVVCATIVVGALAYKMAFTTPIRVVVVAAITDADNLVIINFQFKTIQAQMILFMKSRKAQMKRTLSA